MKYVMIYKYFISKINTHTHTIEIRNVRNWQKIKIKQKKKEITEKITTISKYINKLQIQYLK